MKKRLYTALCLTGLFVLLAGCMGDAYSRKEAEDLEMKGIRMMSAFLSEHTERGIVMVADPLEEYVYGGPDRLTEYVEGTYSDVDGVWEYRINTETGEVYTSRHWAELEELVGRQALKVCALPPEAAIEELEISQYMLPHEQPELMNVPETAVWGAPVLPFGVEAEDYLRDADRRETIRITKLEVSLPDGTGLSELHLEPMLFAWGGVELEALNVTSGTEYVNASPGWLTYQRWAEREDQGFVLRGIVESRGESWNRESGVIETTQTAFDLNDVWVEEEANGWFWLRFEGGEADTYVRVFVRDGSKYLEHKYTAFFSDGDYEFMGWWECGDGLWELSINAPGKHIGFSRDAEMKIRSPEMGF